jgi:hypothetical protein
MQGLFANKIEIFFATEGLPTTALTTRSAVVEALSVTGLPIISGETDVGHDNVIQLIKY